MPRGDGTGPMGMGAMTGRAAGFCAGYGVPGFMNSVPAGGRGFGRGRGFGMGRGMGFGFRGGRGWGGSGMPMGAYGAPPAGPAVADETEMLRGQAAQLDQALKSIRARLSELESAKGSDE